MMLRLGRLQASIVPPWIIHRLAVGFGYRWAAGNRAVHLACIWHCTLTWGLLPPPPDVWNLG